MRKDTHKQRENNSSSDSDSYLPFSLLLSCLLFPFVPVRWLRAVTTKKWVEYTQRGAARRRRGTSPTRRRNRNSRNEKLFKLSTHRRSYFFPFLFSILLESWASKEEKWEKSSSSSSCCFFSWILRPLYKYIHLTIHYTVAYVNAGASRNNCRCSPLLLLH